MAGGCVTGHVINLDQSQASIQVTRLVLTNQTRLVTECNVSTDTSDRSDGQYASKV